MALENNYNLVWEKKSLGKAEAEDDDDDNELEIVTI